MSKPELQRFVFVTGMFRSGTTLLARMLNAHPHIAFASDPYARIFRAFRNTVSEREFGKDKTDYNAPLSDYYYYTEEQKLMKEIQKASFDISTNSLDLLQLKRQIASASRPFSPKIEPFLDSLNGKSFSDLFISGLNIIKQAYGDTKTQLLGFKEVWTGEFAGHILRKFPEAKAIHIVRDPRAVCASKNVKDEKYPWIFLARQWRKLATFAWIDQRAPEYKDRVLLVKYETLVSKPFEQVKRICEFLDVAFDKNILDPKNYTDGEGKPWYQNSSHFNAEQKINPKSITQWEEVLSKEEIEFVESICYYEMKEFDYKIVELKNPKIPLSLVFAPLKSKIEDLADWIIPYYPNDDTSLVKEMGLECLRMHIIRGEDFVSDDVKRALCLSTEFFNQIQETL